MIITPNQVANDLKISTEYCVIGSGAAGAVVAANLAQAGKEVVILEGGGHYPSSEFDKTEKMMPKLYAEKGLRTSDDLSLVILAGANVGGGTTVNWTMCFRTPEYVLDEWQRDFQLEGFSRHELDPYFDRVEKRIGAKVFKDSEHNPNNKTLLDGGKALGFKSYAAKRNAPNCVKSGLCSYGCPYDAKQGTMLTYIPDALKAGAKLYSNCYVDIIEKKKLKATISDRDSGVKKANVELKFKKLIICAGAVETAGLLLRSGYPNSNDVLGTRFFCHPTIGLGSLYDQKINLFYGMPQSVAVDRYNLDGQGGGYKLEAAPAFPGLAAMALPGFGNEHRVFMQQLPHTTAHIVLVRDRNPMASIGLRKNGWPLVRYQISDTEVKLMQQGLTELSQINLSQGAKKIITFNSEPAIINSEKDLAKIQHLKFGVNEHTMFTAHQMSTCPMGNDKSKTVVNSHGQLWDWDDVYVMDGSVMPNSPGVNPMVSIMGIADKLSTNLVS